MTDSSLFDADASSLVEVDDALLDAVTSHWSDTLSLDNRCDEIARSLGLTRELAAQFNVGLSDRSLGLRIPSRQLKAGRILRERLESLGIFRSSGHEAFRGCLVVPVRRGGTVVAIFASRLDRPSDVLWANGLPGGIFEHTVASNGQSGRTLSVLTTSIPDALSICGALEVDPDRRTGELAGAMSILAPARPKGYSVKDLKEIAARNDELVVAGRGGDDLVDRLRAYGARVTPVGSDLDIARSLATAPDSVAALARLLAVPSPPRPGSLVSTPSPVEPEAPGPAVPGHDASVEADRAGHVAVCVTTTPGRDETFLQIGTRRWRLRGARVRSNAEGDRLALALSVSDATSGRFHLDTLDLYSARQRAAFLDAAAKELHVERDLLVAELVHVLQAGEVARDEPREDAVVVDMSAPQRSEALAWLEDPDLLSRLADDLGRLGVVGEETNLMVCYLAALSRKCERPFGVLIQSSSAGGKSTLVDAVTGLIPPEDLVSLSAITAQALFYLGGTELRHKVLFVAEEHGSSRAAYALKLLVSEGRLSIASTGNDPGGQPRTKSFETLGPMSLMMTTTSTTLDPELENRLVVLGVDEDPAQTGAVMTAQRRAASLAGLRSGVERDRVRARQRNAQRLLEPLVVVVPDGPVTFPSSAARHRRDHAKFLSMVMAIALLHQHQREPRSVVIDGVELTYLEATAFDIDVATELCSRVLARDTEYLAPQARRLLDAMRQHATRQSTKRGVAAGDVNVTRRGLRELLGWSDRQVRNATERLVELEYLVVSGGGRGRCRTYELVPDFVPLLRGDESDVVAVGEVGRPEGRSPDRASSGNTERFAEFAPFAAPSGGGTSSTELSYTQMAADGAGPEVDS